MTGRGPADAAVGRRPGPGAIVFDCDGVLVDSEILVLEVEVELLAEAGFPIGADELAETCIGLNHHDMMTLLAERFGRPIPDDLARRMRHEPIACFPDRLQPVPGIADVLDRVTTRRCVASSSDLSRIHLSLKVTGLDHHFPTDTIYSAEMVERGKPAPDLFLHAAAGLSVDPADCVVVEDSPHGVTGALAAGMSVIGFTGAGHGGPALAERLRRAGASTVAASAAELGELLPRR